MNQHKPGSLFEAYHEMRTESVENRLMNEEFDQHGPPLLPLPPFGPIVGGPGSGLVYPAALYWWWYINTHGAHQDTDKYFQDAEDITNTTPDNWTIDDVRSVGLNDIRGGGKF